MLLLLTDPTHLMFRVAAPWLSSSTGGSPFASSSTGHNQPESPGLAPETIVGICVGVLAAITWLLEAGTLANDRTRNRQQTTSPSRNVQFGFRPLSLNSTSGYRRRSLLWRHLSLRLFKDQQQAAWAC